MKIFFQFLYLLILFMLPFNTRADNEEPTPPVVDREAYGWVGPFPKDIEDPEIPPIIIKRTPSFRLSMVITWTGVCIPGVHSRDILFYEILDLEDVSVGSFMDGSSFAQTLFSLSGEYQVRFHTSSYLYVGCVEL